MVSLASTVDLPSPRMSVSDTAAKFAEKKLSLTDMVLLLGMDSKHIKFKSNVFLSFTSQPRTLSNLNLVYDIAATLVQITKLF